MKPHRLERHALLFGALVMLVGAPGVAHACPMCFTGGNSNSMAFVWGSLLLMFVPTAAIGTLVYLAWRRIRDIDSGFVRPPLATATAQQPSDAGNSERVSGERPALRDAPAE
jgi:hypothetical protein